ncbi:MAG: hypothetical protein P8M12_04450 [Flavobacteriales bacterium]|nr:hypothetical protein [Flavobacteriales bacterium]
MKNIFLLTILLTAIISCRKVNNDCNENYYSNAPNQNWFKSHNGSQEEAHGHYILSCSDGGFLQVGETGFIPNSASLFVVKTNSSGDLIWKKEYSSSGHNLGNSAIEIADGYIICGAINQKSTILKVNKSNGQLISQSTFNNLIGNNAIEHICETPSGFAAVGYQNAEDPNNTFFTEGNGILLLIDSVGNLTGNWDINSLMAHGYRIINHNNELIISGLTEGAKDYALVKTSISGNNVLWNKTFGGNGNDHCFGLDVNANGEIFLTGHTKSGTENWDTFTIKTSNDGDKLWEVVKGNPRGFDPKYIHDETWGIKATTDGGCIIVAGTGDEYGNYNRKCGSNESSNTWRVYLIKFNNNGSINWEKTYIGNEGHWAGEDIDLTVDGGAIIAVDNGQFGFLKIDPF